jgi:hypothetical protein
MHSGMVFGTTYLIVPNMDLCFTSLFATTTNALNQYLFAERAEEKQKPHEPIITRTIPHFIAHSFRSSYFNNRLTSLIVIFNL